MFLQRLALAFALAQGTAASGLRDTLASQPDLSTFKSLVDQYDVWNAVPSLENITVLAPNNAAYEILGKIGLNLSETGPAFTVPILQYHFLEGVQSTDDFTSGPHANVVHTALNEVNTTETAPVQLYQSGGEYMVEGGLQLSSGVVRGDIAFDGGMVHVLNSTLVAPHNISATAFMGHLYEFLEMMQSADMIEELEWLHDATVFIPSDAAWSRYRGLLDLMSAKQQAKVLSYHAVEGQVIYQEDLARTPQNLTTKSGKPVTVKVDEAGNVLVNGVPVIQENLVWSGGVAHVIDDVLTPRTNDKPSAAEKSMLMSLQQLNTTILRAR
jgi:uncharacterized surface protein with fasciclin (FAS1) repeats